MEDIIEGNAIITIKDVFKRVCGSDILIQYLLDNELIENTLVKDFKVFVLAKGGLEYNTLSAPIEDIAGVISWRVEAKCTGKIGISEWANLVGWRVTCTDIGCISGSNATLRSVSKLKPNFKLPATLMDSSFNNKADRAAELDAVEVWVKTHNTMIAKVVRELCGKDVE